MSWILMVTLVTVQVDTQTFLLKWLKITVFLCKLPGHTKPQLMEVLLVLHQLLEYVIQLRNSSNTILHWELRNLSISQDMTMLQSLKCKLYWLMVLLVLWWQLMLHSNHIPVEFIPFVHLSPTPSQPSITQSLLWVWMLTRIILSKTHGEQDGETVDSRL